MLTRAGIAVGDRLLLGDRHDSCSAASSPASPTASSDGFSFGPRLMIAADALPATGLIQPGSLVEWRYRVACAGQPAGRRGHGPRRDGREGLSRRGLAGADPADAAPSLDSNIQRFAEFLTLIGLTALVVGGVGVANAVSSYLEGKRDGHRHAEVPRRARRIPGRTST